MDDDLIMVIIFGGGCILNTVASISANNIFFFVILAIPLCFASLYNLRNYLDHRKREQKRQQNWQKESERHRTQKKQTDSKEESDNRAHKYRRKTTSYTLVTVIEALSILGLNSMEPWKNVKIAWRTKIKECHPDRVDGNVEKAKTVNSAYNKLKQIKRKNKEAFAGSCSK